MKKSIIYYLVTAALILSLSSCGEISDESSSKGAKPAAQVSVSSEADEVSDSVSLNETESEIDLGFNGEFNEEVFEKICQNVQIGDKVYSFPCTINDLGEDFELRNRDEDYDYPSVSGNLYCNGQYTAAITLDGNEGEDSTKRILGFSIFDDDFFHDVYDKTALNYNISFGGMRLRMTKDDITSKLGKPTNIIERDDGSCKMDYAIDDKRMIIFRTADTGKVKSIALILGGI